uniref:Uncharacterized protein n=1 Tax=Ciona savignyi TaxID=51511 RepID=H2ZA29_CIOSA
ETQQILRLSLTEFCLPKFYLLFGIPHVKSAADIAFKSDSIGNSGCLDNDDVINLSFLDTVVDALLEVMEACMKDLRGSDWLNEWLDLSHKFAFQYNPSLQPRALVVLGCIAKHASLRHVKQIVWIMERALEPQIDPILLEATILCLTRLQLIVCAKPEFHSCLFWIGISVMQLNVKNLFSAGLSLVEQNLHNLDEMGAFAKQPPSIVLMNASVEHHLMDTSVDVSFKSDFHFAFVTHLLKGFRHGDSVVLQRVIRILDFSLELISRHRSCSKYEINLESIAYIAGGATDSSNNSAVSARATDSSNNSVVSALSDISSKSAVSAFPDSINNSLLPIKADSSNNSAASEKSCSSTHSAVSSKSDSTNNIDVGTCSTIISKYLTKLLNLFIINCHEIPSNFTPQLCEPSHDSDSSASSASHITSSMTSSRRKHSTDVTSNVLLDDEMLDQKYQALLLTQLASQVCHSPNKSDVQIVYEYLAEASSIFPAVFPIVHSLLDQKINSVLNYCEDPVILSHVQIIVHNALLCQDDCMLRSLSFIQDVGFGGMCRFVGPFAK